MDTTFNAYGCVYKVCIPNIESLSDNEIADIVEKQKQDKLEENKSWYLNMMNEVERFKLKGIK